MNNSMEKPGISAQTIDDLTRERETLKAQLDAASVELTECETRYAYPEPDDTSQTLLKLEKQIADLRRTVHLLKAQHARVVAEHEAAERENELAEDRRRRADLEARVKEMVARFPTEYKRFAEQLTGLVGEFYELDKEINAFNATRSAGIEPLRVVEEIIRWTPSEISKHRSTIVPARLADIFEIPALQFGDRDYRVSGTMRPGGIWTDVNGAARR